jgi:hypothetical protein
MNGYANPTTRGFCRGWLLSMKALFSMDFSLCLTEMQIIIAVASNSGRRLVREYNIERKKVWIEAL